MECVKLLQKHIQRITVAVKMWNV